MVTLPCQVEQVDCGHAWNGIAGTGASQPMDDPSRVKELLRSLLLWRGRSLEASRTAGFKVSRCNKSARFVTLPTMTTTQSKHRARGIHAIGGKTHQPLPGNGSNLPEYPEQPEAQVVISSAPNPRPNS